MRTCRKCGATEDSVGFLRVHPVCKPCASAAQAEWYQRNRERVRAKRRGIIAADPEKHRKKRAEYFQRTKDHQREKNREWRAANKPRAAFNGFVRRTLKRCAVKNIPFDITPEYLERLYEKQRGKCALTGEDMAFATDSYSLLSCTVDRIVPVKGYVDGNVRLVCFWINTARGNKTDDELFSIMQKALEYRRSTNG